MSDRFTVFLLVEDKRHQSFLRRFLLKNGIDKREMKFAPVPDGRGSGKQWVLNQFANQVRICRARNMRASSSLIAMMDADELTVDECMSGLDERLSRSGLPRVEFKRDRIARLVPKWSIETWILFLSAGGGSFPSLSEDEPQKDSKTDKQWDELTPRASETFYRWTRNAELRPANLLNSLRVGLQQVPRALFLDR